MIVVDTSAIIAILKQEPEARALSERIARKERMLLSAANYVEAGLVSSKLKTNSFDPAEWLDSFMRVSNIELEAVTPAIGRLALAAFYQYGKGTGHPAQLNFGDCLSYALAKSLNVPLLYKGGDFAQTDATAAL